MKSRLLILIGVTLMLGCGAQNSTGVGNPGLTASERELVAQGALAVSASDDANTLMAIPIAGVISLDPDTAVLEASSSMLFFLPSGCLRTVEGVRQVTFTLNCQSGPYGLGSAVGTMTATYAAGPTGLSVDVATDGGFTLDGRPVALTASGTMTVLANTERSLTWTGHYVSSTPGTPTPTDYTANYTATLALNGRCIAFSGTQATAVQTNADGTTQSLDITVADYQRCGSLGTCPTGGSFSYSASESVVNVSSTSTIVVGRNGSSDVPRPLACNP